MEGFDNVKWLNYSVFNGKLDAINFDGGNNKLLVNTINQYSFCVAEKDEEFKTALINSDILLPDGIGVVVAIKRMLGLKVNKIAGADMHAHLLNLSELGKKKVFYLGSSDATLQKIKERIGAEYPNITIETYSPPYKPVFSDLDNKKMLNAINAFKPDVLFVGMTAPKQEKWANEFKERIDAGIICTIGAVFDFYAGTVSRPKQIWIDLGLEWFVRFLKEPGRMWKRYFYYGPVFIFKLSKLSRNREIS